MIYPLIRWSLCAVLEIVWATAATRILTMRSNAVFYAIRAANFTADMLFRSFYQRNTVDAMLMILIADISVPIIMSVGSPRTRITRTALLNAGKVFSELIGATIYSLLTGGTAVPSEVGPDNVSKVIFVYLLLIFVTAIMFEIIATVCAYIDNRSSSPFEAPVAILLISSIFPFMATYIRLFDFGADSLRQSLPALAYCWLSLAGIYLTFQSASREAESQREAAELATATRRERHARAEADALSRRAEGMISLRHALANEARTVRRLAETGQTEEAGRRLAGLQAQAHVLNGGTNAFE